MSPTDVMAQSDATIAVDGDGDSEENDDDSWDDWQEEEPAVASLLDPSQRFASLTAALDADAASGFDFVAVVRDNGLDFYGAVRLVNFVRSIAPIDALALSAELINNDAWRTDPRYLKPELADDALLIHLDQVLDDEPAEADALLEADFKAVVARLAHATSIVRLALESTDFPHEELRGIADLADDVPPAILEDDNDTRRTRTLKRELSAAREKLLLVARRAKELLVR